MVRRRKHSERGAAVFVVVLVITLLTAIGVFAARSAGLQTQATGYHRQAVQAQAVADFGLQATAVYYALTTQPALMRGDPYCQSTAQQYYVPDASGVAQPPPCQRVLKSSVSAALPYRTALIDPGSTTVYGQGSLGPALRTTASGGAADSLGAIDGNFRVEVSAPSKAPVRSMPGMAIAGPTELRMATFMAYGSVQPQNAAVAGTCDPGTLSATVTQTLRATVYYTANTGGAVR